MYVMCNHHKTAPQGLFSDLLKLPRSHTKHSGSKTNNPALTKQNKRNNAKLYVYNLYTLKCAGMLYIESIDA